MPVVTFDTLKFVETLEKAGVSRAQATAFSDAVRESHAAADLTTKADLREVRTELQQYESAIRSDLEKLETSLRGDMEKLETSLRGDMEKLETSLRGDMERLETSLRHEISTVRQEFNGKFLLLQWMLGVVVAGVAALVIKSFF